MIKIGKYNTLEVVKKTPQGFYLKGDEEWDDILLPNKFVPEGLEVGEDIEVFIHFDSKDLIVATTQRPYGVVGEFALLKVSSVEEFGVFLDWGLDKELFVPFREQLFKMKEGHSYAVYIYTDNSDRLAASTRISQFVDKSKPLYEVGEEVDLLTYQETEMGIKAIINGKHSGLIYKDDIRSELRPGQKIKGYIKKVREDFKIDLSLQPDGLRGRKDLSEQILDKIKDSGGSLEVTSKTSADVISDMFGVSRKKFKVALGYLYKKELITISENSISLAKK